MILVYRSRGGVAFRHRLFVAVFAGLSAAPAFGTAYFFDPDGVAPLNDGGGSWNTSTSNWSADGISFGPWTNSTADIASFGNKQDAAGTVTVDGTLSANGLAFSTTGSGTYTIAPGSGTLTLGGTLPSIAAGVDAVVTAPIAGTAGVIKTGTATLTLSGSTLTGGVTIQGGTLKQGAANAFASQSLTVTGFGAATSTLDLNGFDLAVTTVGLGGTSNTSSTGTSNITGTGALNLGGTLTYANSTAAAGSTVSTTTINLNGNRTFNVFNSGAAAIDLSVKAVIANGTASAAVLTKGQAGTLELTGMNTFTGGTTLQNGDTIITVIGVKTKPGNLGNVDTITLGNGVNAVGQIVYNGNGETTDRAININAGGTGGGMLTANNTAVGAVSLKFTSDLTVTDIAGNKALTLNGTGTGEFGGKIIDAATAGRPLSLTKGQAGTWTLTAVNTFTGGMTIQNGVLIVSSIGNKTQPGNLGNNDTINIGNGAATGQLKYTGAGETTNRVINLSGTTGGATIINESAGTLAFSSDLTALGVGTKNLRLQGNGANGQWNGAIVDNATATGNRTNLIKDDPGTWSLGGVSSYTGTTTVTAGVLKLSAAGSISTSPSVSIASAGVFDVNALGNYTTSQTISGTGAVSGLVTLNSGGKIVPGTSPGVINFSSLDISPATDANNGALVFDIAQNDGSAAIPNDKISVAGSLNVGNLDPADFNFIPTFPTANATYTLLSSTTLTGVVNTSTFSLDGFTAKLDKSGNSVILTLTGTPEPTTAGMMALAVGGLLSRRRRRSSVGATGQFDLR